MTCRSHLIRLIANACSSLMTERGKNTSLQRKCEDVIKHSSSCWPCNYVVITSTLLGPVYTTQGAECLLPLTLVQLVFSLWINQGSLFLGLHLPFFSANSYQPNFKTKPVTSIRCVTAPAHHRLLEKPFTKWCMIMSSEWTVDFKLLSFFCKEITELAARVTCVAMTFCQTHLFVIETSCTLWMTNSSNVADFMPR